MLFLGVMLGAWPCGIIVLLGELFGTESISQVYAFLHTFLQMNNDSTNDISKDTNVIMVKVTYLVAMYNKKEFHSLCSFCNL